MKRTTQSIQYIHAKIYPTKFIQTKTYMLVANHQVTHLHLARSSVANVV